MDTGGVDGPRYDVDGDQGRPVGSSDSHILIWLLL